MAEAPSLDEQVRICQQRLDVVDFILGDWEGRGTSHGEPFRAHLTAQRCMERTFVEVREVHFGPGDEVVHEDRSYYHWDRVEDRLQVTHMMAPAWLGKPFVEAISPGPGLRWISGPMAPRVEITPDGPDGLEVGIWFPGSATPAVQVTYRRRSK